MSNPITGTVQVPKMANTEIRPGVWLLEEPHPVEGTDRMRCLAEVDGCLCVIEL